MSHVIDLVVLVYVEIMDISKNFLFPLLWRGIKGEVKKQNEFLEMPLFYFNAWSKS